MCFKADSFHHQHTVTKQALNTLLVQLLEEMAAVSSNWVHAPPSRRPRTKDMDKLWFLTPSPEIKWHPNPVADLCFTVMIPCHNSLKKRAKNIASEASRPMLFNRTISNDGHVPYLHCSIQQPWATEGRWTLGTWWVRPRNWTCNVIYT